MNYLILFFCSLFFLGSTDVTLIRNKSELISFMEKVDIDDFNAQDFIFFPIKKDQFYILHKYLPCYQKKNSKSTFCYYYTNRSLSNLDFKIRNHRTSVFKELKKVSAPLSIVELGPGQGRIMLEILEKFPESKIIGINKGTKDDFGLNKLSLQHFNDMAQFFEISISQKIISNQITMKYEDINDGRLDFLMSNSVDFLYSVETIRYLKNKITLLEEIWRVLRPGGFAIFTMKNFYLKNKKGEVKSLHSLVLKQLENTEGDMVHDPITDTYIIRKKKNKNLSLPIQIRHFELIKLNQCHDNKEVVGWHSHYTVM